MHMDSLMELQRLLLIAIHKLIQTPQIRKAHFRFSDGSLQNVLALSMHYMNQYWRVYPLKEPLTDWERPLHRMCAEKKVDPRCRCFWPQINTLEKKIMLLTALGFAFKVLFNEFVLERLPIHDKLKLLED